MWTQHDNIVYGKAPDVMLRMASPVEHLIDRFALFHRFKIVGYSLETQMIFLTLLVYAKKATDERSSWPYSFAPSCLCFGVRLKI